jgi:hypothetical protein
VSPIILSPTKQKSKKQRQKKGKNSKVGITKNKKEAYFPFPSKLPWPTLYYFCLYHFSPKLIMLLVLPLLSWEPVKLEQ